MFFVSLIVSLSPVMVSAADSVPSGAKHIKTADELAAIGGAQSAGEYYVLDNDINLNAEWRPIDDFRGTFDGQGHTINNLYVLEGNRPQFVGLFGRITASGTAIKNVGVNIGSKGIATSSIATYATVCAGGLVGYGDVTITNCYVKGDVSAAASGYGSHAAAGGLIGYGNGIITKCYVSGDITATASDSASSAKAGGLIGYGGRTFTNCYVTGDVTAKSSASSAYAGGLLGQNSVTGITATNCYVTGGITASASGNARAGDLIGYDNIAVKSCYRLSTQKITGDTVNTLGDALSSSEMKNQQSFAGWDFEAIWAIKSNVNNGYPYLKDSPSSSGKSSSDGSSSGGSSTDGLSPLGNPLVIAGVASIAAVAIIAAVVFMKKRK